MLSKKRNMTILQTITIPIRIQQENDLQHIMAKIEDIVAALAKLNKVEIGSIQLEE